MEKITAIEALIYSWLNESNYNPEKTVGLEEHSEEIEKIGRSRIEFCGQMAKMK